MEEKSTENTEEHGSWGILSVFFRAFRGLFTDFLHSLSAAACGGGESRMAHMADFRAEHSG